MASEVSKGKYNLICVAHPDDETIFFGGLILRKEANRLPWVVLCVTSDGNEDRKRQFHEACDALGVDSPMWWGFPDRYEQRLNVNELSERLRAEFSNPPENIYTHCIIGEYGHPHHQDVSFAVHTAFRDHPRVFAVAYNAYPDFTIALSEADFEKKSYILTKIYGSETSRFLNVLPSTFVEGFLRLDYDEVDLLYSYFARPESLSLDVNRLKKYRWLTDYLPRLRGLPRPF